MGLGGAGRLRRTGAGMKCRGQLLPTGSEERGRTVYRCCGWVGGWVGCWRFVRPRVLVNGPAVGGWGGGMELEERLDGSRHHPLGIVTAAATPSPKPSPACAAPPTRVVEKEMLSRPYA
eukprot:scaffold9993_cov101-Isochrysis_galbana.AAC.10